jgi:hypothetical protein
MGGKNVSARRFRLPKTITQLSRGEAGDERETGRGRWIQDRRMGGGTKEAGVARLEVVGRGKPRPKAKRQSNG